MKKILLIFLSIVLAFTLSACGVGAGEEPNEKVNSTLQTGEEQTEEEKLKELFLTKGKEGNRYFGDEVTFGSDKGFDKKYWYTPLNLSLREVNLSGTGVNQSVIIGVLTDTHLRPDDAAIKAFEETFKIAGLTDQTVICGDIVEGFAYKNCTDIFKSYFENKNKGVILAVGNHDKYSSDQAENEQFLAGIWPHDHNFYTKTVKDSVVLVTVNNSADCFTDTQCELFLKEIDKARKDNKRIIFICHVPPSTLDNAAGANARMYSLLTENTDVVLAVVAGHAHGDSKTMLGSLPQYALEGTGHGYMRNNLLLISVE